MFYSVNRASRNIFKNSVQTNLSCLHAKPSLPLDAVQACARLLTVLREKGVRLSDRQRFLDNGRKLN